MGLGGLGQVEVRFGRVLPWRDGRTTNKQTNEQGKIELLSQWTKDGWDEQFEQFMELYRNLCRFCSKFVWRKICLEKIFVEKKWQIWGLVGDVDVFHRLVMPMVDGTVWWFFLFMVVLNNTISTSISLARFRWFAVVASKIVVMSSQVWLK